MENVSMETFLPGFGAGPSCMWRALRWGSPARIPCHDADGVRRRGVLRARKNRAPQDDI